MPVRVWEQHRRYTDVFTLSLTHAVYITPNGNWLKNSRMLSLVNYLNCNFYTRNQCLLFPDRHLVDNF